MENLREYFYPFIDKYGCKMTYEFRNASSGQPYRKSIITPGISIPDYPTAPGSTYFTREDSYWNGYAWANPNWWYMRQRDSSVIEEIADTCCGNTIYYLDKVITHAQGAWPHQYVREPIDVWWRGSNGIMYKHPYGKLWSSCTFVKHHSYWAGFPNVVEMDFVHGSYWGAAGQACPGQPPQYPHKHPYTTYWQKIWFVKGVGQLYSTILWDERSCSPAWSYYLHTCYGG